MLGVVDRMELRLILLTTSIDAVGYPPLSVSVSVSVHVHRVYPYLYTQDQSIRLQAAIQV